VRRIDGPRRCRRTTSTNISSDRRSSTSRPPSDGSRKLGQGQLDEVLHAIAGVHRGVQVDHRRQRVEHRIEGPALAAEEAARNCVSSPPSPAFADDGRQRAGGHRAEERDRLVVPIGGPRRRRIGEEVRVAVRHDQHVAGLQALGRPRPAGPPSSGRA
jgi:hypothetical protein